MLSKEEIARLASQAVRYEMPRRSPPPRCSAWLAVEPETMSDPARQLQIIGGMGTTFLPRQGHASLFTGESGRQYGVTPRGVAALRRALERNPHTGITIIGGSGMPEEEDEVGYHCGIEFGPPPYLPNEPGPHACIIKVDYHTDWDEDLTARLLAIREFVRHWAPTLNAQSAFVSDNAHDRTTKTQCEDQYGYRGAYWSPFVEQRVRGAFWCNYLGPDLCKRLGGREYVLANAPAAIREPLGNGVWLQTSEHPTPGVTQPMELLAFLTPVHPQPQTCPIERYPSRIVPDPPRAARPVTSGEPVPIEVVGEMDTDVAFRIYLKDDAPPDTYDALIATVTAWFEAGFNGAYPFFIEEDGSTSGSFHFLDDPTIDTDERCIRWHVDTGSGDSPTAFEDLARLLNMLPSQPVSKLALGIEVIE